MAGAKEMKYSIAPNKEREAFFVDANRISGEELFDKYFLDTFLVKAEDCIRLTCYKLSIYCVAKKYVFDWRINIKVPTYLDF